MGTNIKKSGSRGPNLSRQDKEFLMENYFYLSDDALAEILGSVSGTSIRKIRSNLGLKRNVSQIKKLASTTPLVIWLQRDLYESEPFESFIQIAL